MGATPGVPEPPVSQRISLTKGWTPDYRSLILADPSYLSWKNSSDLDVANAASARKAALQALAIRYGGLGTLKDTYGDIDQTTLDLAKANEFSDLARTQQNYTLGVEGLKRALAARRMLQSGELPYGLEQAERARASSEYDLGQEFANAYQGVINDYTSRENAAHVAEAKALADAEAAVYANPANQPVPGTEATLDPDWQAKYGTPVYVADDGTLYVLDASGNPTLFTPPAPAPAPVPSYTEPTPTLAYPAPTTTETTVDTGFGKPYSSPDLVQQLIAAAVGGTPEAQQALVSQGVPTEALYPGSGLETYAQYLAPAPTPAPAPAPVYTPPPPTREEMAQAAAQIVNSILDEVYPRGYGGRGGW